MSRREWRDGALFAEARNGSLDVLTWPVWAGAPPSRLDETVRRGRAYLDAGADVVFVPGLLKPDAVRAVMAAVPGPLNLMMVPGAPGAPALLHLGVQRVSVGQGVLLASMGLVAEVARELRTAGTAGTSPALDRYFYGFAEAEALFG